MELSVEVIGLNYTCNIKVNEYGSCKDIFKETCLKYKSEYPNAEIPLINRIYKTEKKIHVRSRELIQSVFKSQEKCYVGIKKNPTKYQNENEAICKYDFTVVFHTRDIGWRLIHDTEHYRVGKIQPTKAAGYFQRLIPGTIIIHIENERIDKLDKTQLYQRIESLPLPILMGFRGTIAPSVPKMEVTTPTIAIEQQNVLSPTGQIPKDSETQLIQQLQQLKQQLAIRKKEVYKLEKQIYSYENRLAKVRGSVRLSEDALRQLQPPSPVHSENSNYSSVSRQFRRSSKAPSEVSISSTCSKSSRHSYLHIHDNPGVGAYNVPSTFTSKGGRMSQAKTSRSSYIPKTSGPGVGMYTINYASSTKVKGGEIGDSTRELKWV